MRRGLFTLFIAACVVSVTTASSTDALELPKPQPVEKYLGKSAAGANYTVQPIVRRRRHAHLRRRHALWKVCL